jgi:hypothetical protein
MSSSPMMKMDQDYQREDDHRTLTHAAEIQADKSRMAGVQKHHRKVKKQHSLVGRMLMSKGRR